ncbi:MAG TPA: FkbM family methyltransferase [Steroidobacteraceae bacterium]|nr:FkbM family methyltransferase [Steroidobacteraceae bacterium]
MRAITKFAKAAFQWRHYRAAANMLRTYERPGATFLRYLFGGGQYPARISLSTPIGPIAVTLYSEHDLLTVNEIFCRRDYQASDDAELVADFGSNIGISALYFLTRNPRAYAYLYEPLPANLERLRSNLAGFEGRYQLFPFAVGMVEGPVQFGCEPTGRYGGIGLARETQITVPCRPANSVLDEILSRHGHLDVLKVDIESFEKEIILGLGERARRIETIFVENRFDSNPLQSTHSYRQYGSVAQFRRRNP